MSPVTTSDGGAKQLVGTNKEREISSSIVVGAVVIIVVVLARRTPRSCARSRMWGRSLLEVLGSRSFVFFVSGRSCHTAWSLFVSVAGGVTAYSGLFPGRQSASSVVKPSS